MTWADGFATYLCSYEVRLHKRTKTFGSREWLVGTPGLIGPQRQLEIAMAATGPPRPRKNDGSQHEPPNQNRRKS